MNNKFFIHAGMNIIWNDENGMKYLLSIENDEDSYQAYEDFGFLSDLYCWHRKYNFGIDHNFPSGHAFWLAMTEKYVSEEELISFVINGNIEGEKLVKNEDGSYDMTFEEFPDFCYNHEQKWKIVEEIKSSLSNQNCQQLLQPYVEWLPVWMYDHSGQTIRCSESNSFNDRFDSGQLGIVIIDRQKVISEFSAAESDWREKAREIMSEEVALYNEYVEGNIFGYVSYKFVGNENSSLYERSSWSECEPSVWGFIGDDIFKNGMLECNEGLRSALESDHFETSDSSII